MKQTAVEWLIQEWPILEAQLPQWLIEQVKQMEKEQIEQAYFDGCNYMENGFGKNPTEYYKSLLSETIVTEYRDGSIDVETFKKE
jgi:hypothetical protein